jgi:signal transduction histidine kinase
LRARLTAAATAIILVGIVAAAVALVLRLHNVLLSNLDDTVTAQVHTVAADAAHGRMQRPLPGSGEGAAAVQVVSPSGRVLTSTKNIDDSDPLFRFSTERGDVTLVSVHHVGDDETTYRVAGLSARTPTGPVTVYAGLPTVEVNRSITELVGALAVGVPVIIVVLAVVGWLLIGRALRPVDAMRQQAAAIPGTDLHRRLEAPAADDELGRLAATFNALLARIEADSARQRQFVADAAHELRSPLAALRTQLEVAVRRRGPAEIGPAGTDLLADTVRLSRLVDDLLALARLDASPHLAHQPVDLDDLLLDEARRARSRGGVRIDTMGISAGRVLGDPQALGRVTRNLVDNAVRHASISVSLGLQMHGGTVTLTVADDGPGIASTDRDRVFQRFTRLDDARGRDTGGAGLGLAIVRDVVTAHGGHVSVADNNPGALFTVRLPAAQDQLS